MHNFVRLFDIQDIQRRLEDTRAAIDRLEREKEDVLDQCGNEERQKIRRLLEDLNSSWHDINDAYSDRHR